MSKHGSGTFIVNAANALQDEQLQTALTRAKSGFINKRLKAISMVDDFELLKRRAQLAKQSALANLPALLEQFEQNVQASGGQVHWAKSPQELNNIVLNLCRTVDASKVTKGKSMIGEETNLNAHLEQAGLKLIETDLGEYIIQLAKEPPSHIIAPAVHKTRQQVATLFKQHHNLGQRDLSQIASLVEEARNQLRMEFLSADVGITGANLLIAETGSVTLVTNEGNGDLTATIPKMHIVTTSIEKVVATLEDADAILEVLARSATGQSMSTYTTFFTGPKRAGDLDGPQQFHVVLLDNGRSDLIGSEFEPMLNCIKCGACLNHCPVYSNVGGHAYGWVYPGPMGSVLTPLLNKLEPFRELPDASTFCGRCEEVCPMGIPLPGLLRKLRARSHRKHYEPGGWRRGLMVYSWLATQPRLFQFCTNRLNQTLRWSGKLKINLSRLPRGWSRHRELPAPGKTFLSEWKKNQKQCS
ncbi:lactate utilization protein [Ketobacter sp. MCCC 1A13808]|uniref:lactate utilization protein B n=1 Tax=Ketobacter sp. MCCC 1A13808 TaxID=2602738 RepID=UPI0012EBAD7D|nr:lactate utilization protein B [Ketobacter sp. MCCC 1A13808]MVF12499.1 lactate utilization protein [Ketobacter sp. MCCC 1A13808]